MPQLFNVNGRWITLEQYQEFLNPKEESKNEDNANSGKYSSVKYQELKKTAKERGIKLTNKEKKEELISLLEEFDNLKDGDKFQGQIAKIATQEFITENKLEDELMVGDLFFIPEVE